MIWHVLTILVVLSVTVYSAPTSTFNLSPIDIAKCQNKCGVPKDVRSNPTQKLCNAWNECNDDERNCAAKGDKFIYSTNAVCKTFAPFPSPASSINTNTGLSVNSITAITTEPLGSTVDFSATPPPSVVTEECKTILQQKDAILMINLINPVEWDMPIDMILCINLNAKTIPLGLEDLATLCGQQQSDDLRGYIDNRRKIHHCDQYP